MSSLSSPPYTGRFAPSPTGELHQGSLFTALASYLDARHCDGRWLVRMEDLDPPREQPGAASAILCALEAHQLYWDGEVMYQSQRLAAYSEALAQLTRAGHTYPCSCSRQRLKGLSAYDGHCRQHPPGNKTCALRLRIPAGEAGLEHYRDLWRGEQRQQLQTYPGDFVIKRKDGLYAYQLAVVVDDIAQGISHIIRGGDLLDSALRQRLLFRLLDARAPVMGHLPILVNGAGQKLSKQSFATPLDNKRAAANMEQALGQLGLPLPAELHGAPCDEQLQWASAHWRRARLPTAAHIQVGTA